MIFRSLKNAPGKAAFACLALGVWIFSALPAQGSISAWEEDVAMSKRVPLISGLVKHSDEILRREKAILTLCTTPLTLGVHHVSLVFEIGNLQDKGINVCMVHFGGDGHTESRAKQGLPDIDGRETTLYKVFRGKKTFYGGRTEYVGPLYERKLCFVVDHHQAEKALKWVEDENARYGMLACWRGYDNCCTYVSKCLGQAGVETLFHDSWRIKRASNLLQVCEKLEHEKPHNYRFSIEDEEFKHSVEALFQKGQERQASQDYQEALKLYLESAQRGHGMAQYFIGLLGEPARVQNIKARVESFYKKDEGHHQELEFLSAFELFSKVYDAKPDPHEWFKFSSENQCRPGIREWAWQLEYAQSKDFHEIQDNKKQALNLYKKIKGQDCLAQEGYERLVMKYPCSTDGNKKELENKIHQDSPKNKENYSTFQIGYLSQNKNSEHPN